MKKISVLLMLLFSLQVFAVNADLHGYLRAGLGSNLKGAKQECFNNSGTNGNEFRYGNECSIYGELSFEMNLNPEIKNHNSKLYLTYSYTGDAKQDWEAGTNQWVLRQIYSELTAEGYFVWAGKRYFRWGDLYLFDFYPMDFTGPGAGISNIKTQNGEWQFALTQNSNSTEFETGTTVTTPIKDAAKTMFHFRKDQYQINDKIKIDFWGIFGTTAATNSGTTTYKATPGSVIATKSYFNFNENHYELALAYGQGSLSNLSPYKELVIDCTDKTQAKCTVSEASRLRAWGSHFIENQNWGIQTGFTLEQQNKATLNTPLVTSTSFGVMPVYFLTDNLQIASVIGYSQIDDQSDGLGIRKLWRLTMGPQWSVKRSFWARPVIRLYYTYTGWNNENMTKFSSTSAANSLQSQAIGAQTEVWF